VLVPTMGALHAGHRSLLEAGRKFAGAHGTLVATIFVNPTQFGPGEDFRRYPRTFADDRKMCGAVGADAIFVPAAEAMYSSDHSVFVEESVLSKGLCGRSRPGHFRGVCTVVSKLFLLFNPQVAVFGEKDWQQLAIIHRMVRDLNFPVRIAGCPTVREPDGLAMSSRNRLLVPAARQAAPGICRALLAIRKEVRGGERRVDKLLRMLAGSLESLPGAKLDYARIVDARSLDPIRFVKSAACALVAVRFGKVRLIDNILLRPPRERI